MIILSLLITGCTHISSHPPTLANTTANESSEIDLSEDDKIDSSDPEPNSNEKFKILVSANIPNVDPAFNFQARIPAIWEVEYVAASLAVNIFDPQAPGDSTLEKSQIFIKYFMASQFLTLSSVKIYSREEITINYHPAVRYEIEKKAESLIFPSQPTWRSKRHFVTDIRSTTQNPTIFYVFAKRPELKDEIYDYFVKSLVFTAELQALDPTHPVIFYPRKDSFKNITKKPFGVFIDPETSPIQPERFTGFHTGVDVEIPRNEDQSKKDEPIFAIADGTILFKGNAAGYGGVLVVLHTINNEPYSAVYGHLRLSSITKHIGDTILAGETLAVLGTGETSETDGERKHLHFGLLRGESTDLRGYVSSKEELNLWIDPVKFYNELALQTLKSNGKDE